VILPPLIFPGTGICSTVTQVRKIVTMNYKVMLNM
jgi:hypothetical protein